jgi:hypothetical protein
MRYLLLCSYLFLFATQLNGRFYSVANFFVYGNTIASSTHTVHSDLRHNDKSTVYQRTTRRSSHLSLDKRFQIEPAVKAALPNFILVPTELVIEREYHTALKVYPSSTDLPPNALRGPPCA